MRKRTSLSLSHREERKRNICQTIANDFAPFKTSTRKRRAESSFSSFTLFPSLFTLFLSSFALFLLFSFSVIAQQTAPFRVMFWNTENTFDTHHDSLKQDKEFLPDAPRHWNYTKYKKKLANLGRVITAVGQWNPPALVGLCEIENDRVMQDLAYYSPLKNQGYSYVMTQSPDIRGIDVALLYRPEIFKLLSYESIPASKSDGNFRPTRDLLHASGLLITGDTLDVIVVHLPSRSGGVKRSEPYRLWVAQKLKTVTDSLIDARLRPKLIIMGDFNDYPTNKSVRQVLKTSMPSQPPLPRQLYHLLMRKAQDRNFGSYKYQGEWGLLDHLIVSGSLIDTTENLYTNEDSADTARLPFLLNKDEKYGGLQPFRTFVGMKYQGGYSDHLPVYFDIYFQNETNQSEY